MITYFDTSVLLKLLLDDEIGGSAAEQLWIASTAVVSCELGYTEARAALDAARRCGRMNARQLQYTREMFENVWLQLDVVPVTTSLVRRAGDLAERDGLRGYDAVHLAAALTSTVDTMASSDLQLCNAASVHGLNVANPALA